MNLTWWFHLLSTLIQNKELMHRESRPQNFSVNISWIWFYLRTHVKLFGHVSVVRQWFGYKRSLPELPSRYVWLQYPWCPFENKNLCRHCWRAVRWRQITICCLYIMHRDTKFLHLFTVKCWKSAQAADGGSSYHKSTEYFILKLFLRVKKKKYLEDLV